MIIMKQMEYKKLIGSLFHINQSIALTLKTGFANINIDSSVLVEFPHVY